MILMMWEMLVCKSKKLKEWESIDGFLPEKNCEWPSGERLSMFGGMGVHNMEMRSYTFVCPLVV